MLKAESFAVHSLFILPSPIPCLQFIVKNPHRFNIIHIQQMIINNECQASVDMILSQYYIELEVSYK